MRIYLIKFFVILITVTTSSLSLAATKSISRQFRVAADRIPHRLIQQGLSNIGSIDFQQLESEISQIPVIVLPKLKVLSTSSKTSRQSGAWSHRKNGNPIIYVSVESWNHSGQKPRSVLALHETLCALSYDDTNYMISLTLYFLSRYGRSIHYDLSKFSNQLSPIIQRLNAPTTSQLMALAGGTTLVGGGGDSVVIAMKLSALDDAGKNLAKAKTDFQREAIMSDVAMIIYADWEANYYYRK